jgi:hypothetical protein
MHLAQAHTANAKMAKMIVKSVAAVHALDLRSVTALEAEPAVWPM